jgi:tetratricopeptide repeat protein/glycosyl transferase family 9 (putative heptosyltransferase)
MPEEGVECEANSAALAPTLLMLSGTAKYRDGQVEDAAAWFERVLRLDPQSVEAWWMLGQCCRDLGLHAKAQHCFGEAVRHEPTSPGGRTSRSFSLLLTGDHAAGWAAYEASRWAGKSRGAHWWNGERIRGHLLLMNDGGYGDAFILARWVPWVREQVGSLTLQVQSSLVRLLQPQFPGVRVTSVKKQVPRFDRCAFLGSVPAVVHLSDPTQIPRAPYLRPPPLSYKLTAPPASLKVGVVWAGSGTVRPERRSFPAGDLAPVLTVPGATFFNLQVGPPALEAANLPVLIHDLSGKLTDWTATATVLAHLDLLITCDTGIAHLAGALGRPVWICLPASADWRWMLERSDTPWYESARLFRQPRVGEWPALFREVSAALEQLVRQRTRVSAYVRSFRDRAPADDRGSPGESFRARLLGPSSGCTAAYSRSSWYAVCPFPGLATEPRFTTMPTQPSDPREGEAFREAAERRREEAELARRQSEEGRQIGERLRGRFESVRQGDEGHRLSAETARDAQEHAREFAEEAREVAEMLRGAAEDARAAAADARAALAELKSLAAHVRATTARQEALIADLERRGQRQEGQ